MEAAAELIWLLDQLTAHDPLQLRLACCLGTRTLCDSETLTISHNTVSVQKNIFNAIIMSRSLETHVQHDVEDTYSHERQLN